MSSRGTFICDNCGGEFPRSEDEAEALAEAARNFGLTPEQCSNSAQAAVVCDDCYKVICGVLGN